MKIRYILGVLLVIMLVACTAPQTPPEEPETAAPEVPEVTTPETAAPAAEMPAEEEAPAEEEKEEVVSQDLEETKNAGLLDPAVVERWKTACIAGNAGLCATLERYGIDPNAGVTTTEENINQEATESDVAEEGVEIVQTEE